MLEYYQFAIATNTPAADVYKHPRKHPMEALMNAVMVRLAEGDEELKEILTDYLAKVDDVYGENKFTFHLRPGGKQTVARLEPASIACPLTAIIISSDEKVKTMKLHYYGPWKSFQTFLLRWKFPMDLLKLSETENAWFTETSEATKIVWQHVRGIFHIDREVDKMITEIVTDK